MRMDSRRGVRSSILMVGTLALLVALAISGAAWAHEGHKHQVKGTVSSLEGMKLVVETTDGKRNLYLLSEQTKFLRGQRPTTREDVVVGERVVVTWVLKDDAERAVEVRLGERRPRQDP